MPIIWKLLIKKNSPIMWFATVESLIGTIGGRSNHSNYNLFSPNFGWNSFSRDIQEGM